ncbi:hypothetical protein LZ30DRAFT_588963 [Colletotrichum cereale]|nr:hypothetical protein LZ30DRAFT_588963 [Colletotrichum cereale]
MTTKPAEKAARPRLNTTVDWSPPRTAAGCSSRPDEGVSPLSTGKHRREGQKEGHGRGGLADGRPQQRRHGSESPAMKSPIPKARDSLGDLSPSVVEELKKMIKEEVAQVAQVVQLKNSEAGTPAHTPRPSLVSSQKPVITPSYPSPPPSVVEARSSPKASSPRDRSPGVTHAKRAPTIPVPADQSTPPVSPQQKTVHFRTRGPSVVHGQPRAGSRSESASPTAPAAAARVELSSVDKAWGMLFDSEGYSTQRLNSVLRGLASFMMAEFGRPETLVVTPDKMLTLYTKYRVEPERFPYQGADLPPDIFEAQSEDALKRVEFLYQDLDCQYHLVQAAPRSHPNVPGLTPAGFAKWMVSNILAYPDPEAKRLHAIVSTLPINADGPLLDGKPERLPRQLSRHLLPVSHDNKVRKILDEAVWDCLEDAAPPLPRAAAPRPGSSHDLASAPEPNAHSARRPPALHRKTHRDLPPPPPPSTYDIRESDADYGVYSGHRDSRGSNPTDESPRSPGLGRRGGAGASRGPTWEEVYIRKGSSGGMVSSVDTVPHRLSR